MTTGVRLARPDRTRLPGQRTSVRTEFYRVRHRALAKQRAVVEMELAFVVIVPAAAEGDVLECRFATRSIRHDVVILEEPAFRAPAAGADKSALATITAPHRSFDRGWDMPRSRSRRPGGARSWWAHFGSLRARQLLPLDIGAPSRCIPRRRVASPRTVIPGRTKWSATSLRCAFLVYSTLFFGLQACPASRDPTSLRCSPSHGCVSAYQTRA